MKRAISIIIIGLSALALSANGGRDLTASSAQCSLATVVPPTTLPFTVVAWYKPRTSASAALVSVDHSSTNNVGRFLLVASQTTASAVFCQAAQVPDSGSGASVNSSASVVTNVWSHFAAVFAGSAARTSYVNGGSAVGNTTAVGTTTVNQIQVGARNVLAVRGLYGDGAIAHIAVWNVALTVAEIVQLSGGGNPSKAVHPRYIRPAALVYCPDMEIPNTVVPDLISGTTTWSNFPPFIGSPTIRR